MNTPTFVIFLGSAGLANAAITLTPNHFVSDADFAAAYRDSPVAFDDKMTAIVRIGDSATNPNLSGDWELGIVDPASGESPFVGSASNDSGTKAQAQFVIGEGLSYDWRLEFDVANSDKMEFSLSGNGASASVRVDDVDTKFGGPTSFNAFAIRTRGIDALENIQVTPTELETFGPGMSTLLPSPDPAKFDGIGADYYAFADLTELSDGFVLTGTMTMNWDENDPSEPSNSELAFQIKLGNTTPGVTPVPEPGSFALLAGLFGLAWVAGRRRLTGAGRGRG